MKVTPTSIPDVLVLEPKVFRDERGFFYESFNQKTFNEATGLNEVFVQDNHSRSTQGVLRGLHYQLPPKAQGKLVRVISGAVWDVAIDIRQSSATFGKWIGVELTEHNQKQLWIPPGFAHGFIVTSESADFVYKTTNYYSPEHQKCIAWDDPNLDIHWPENVMPVLSSKDLKGTRLTVSEIFKN